MNDFNEEQNNEKQNGDDFSLTGHVNRLLEHAFSACGLPTDVAQASRAARPELGDMQCNAAMPLGKRLNRPPREIATAIVAKLRESEDFVSVEIAGPGFINLRFSGQLLSHVAQHQLATDRAGILKESPKRVLLDFGGPNVAKPLHVGHLRSLVIGESLRRILRAQGHATISDVHLGDWGLQMGMLIGQIRRSYPDLVYFQPDADANLQNSGSSGPANLGFGMQELQLLYPEAAAACKIDPERMAEARELTAALQGGHPAYTALWRAIRTISLEAQQRDFAALDAHFDVLLGESDVQSLIPDMMTELRANGIATESDRALVIEVAEEGDSQPMPPLILAKSDGAALYATTDLATILHRVRTDAPDLIVYVVDQRQALHFEQVFRAARRTGYAPPGLKLVHAGFGTVNGPDGKPYKTRQGGVAQLADLLSDAIQKAKEKLGAARSGDTATEDEAVNPSSDAERDKLARQVGIAAVKFADLSSYRTSGYVYDPDRMVSFEGRTGPYVQYACVRIGSIMKRADAAHDAFGPIVVDAPAERVLVIECARFPDVVASAAANFAPNEIADYVYGLAQTFSRFYLDCPVLAAESSEVRTSRLAICALALHVLKQGLLLLGITVPDRM
jgi:arginyl-tRNA synthetase